MGEDMAVYPKVEAYFEGLYAGSQGIEDLTPYFEKRAEYIKEILFLYTQKYNDLEGAAMPLREENTSSKSSKKTEGDELSFSDFCSDEELLIYVFKEMLGEGYQAPSDNLTALQYHLTALWLFYSSVRPRGIDFRVILDLDIVIMKIVFLAAAHCAGIPPQVKEWQSKIKLRRSPCGQPKGVLREVCEHLYNKCEKNGETECLQEGNVVLFVEKMRNSLQKYNSLSFDRYIDKRINDIRKARSHYQIISMERPIKKGGRRTTTTKSKTYSLGNVSTILVRIRKKKSKR